MADKFDYQRYLASREWAQRKEAVRERSQGYCERCLWGDYESTHHLTYKNIGHEPLEDLLAVCNRCHEYLSAKHDRDPRRDVAVWIILGPRSDKVAAERFIHGVSSGKGRFVGGFNTTTGKPVWLVKADSLFSKNLNESAGLSAGFVA